MMWVAAILSPQRSRRNTKGTMARTALPVVVANFARSLAVREERACRAGEVHVEHFVPFALPIAFDGHAHVFAVCPALKATDPDTAL